LCSRNPMRIVSSVTGSANLSGCASELPASASSKIVTSGNGSFLFFLLIMSTFDKLYTLYSELCDYYAKDMPANEQIIRKLERLLVIDRHHINALKLITEPQPYYFVLQCGLWYRTVGYIVKRLQENISNPTYTIYRIAKKSGGYREIAAPCKELKYYQYRLNRLLQSYYSLIRPACVHGFVNGFGLHSINIVSNAACHAGKRYVMNIDVKDFFPSITGEMVYRAFRSVHFGHEAAVWFSLLATYDGRLPAGAPSSPVVSNIVCLTLDHSLMTYSKLRNYAYSRYADDLTFSSDEPFTREQIAGIVSLLRQNGFEVNHRKFRIQSRSSRQTVTGLTVNEKVNIDRRKLKKLRAIFHDIRRKGIEEAAKRYYKTQNITEKQTLMFENSLTGYLQFVRQVKGADFVKHYILKS